MNITGDDVSSDEFSFATDSPWQGLDVGTMRIHSRARVLQSQNRAARLRRENLALGHLLEVARAQHRFEKDIQRQDRREQRMLDAKESAPIIDLRTPLRPTRKRSIVLSDAQPSRANASRRWG